MQAISILSACFIFYPYPNLSSCNHSELPTRGIGTLLVALQIRLSYRLLGTPSYAFIAHTFALDRSLVDNLAKLDAPRVYRRKFSSLDMDIIGL